MLVVLVKTKLTSLLYLRWFWFSCQFNMFLHCSLSAGEIPPSPQCAFVLEDELGICGYALALTDAKPAAAKTQVIKEELIVSCNKTHETQKGGTECRLLFQRARSDLVLKDFPSLVALQVLPRVTDPSPAKRMIGQLLSSIRSSGRWRHRFKNWKFYRSWLTFNNPWVPEVQDSPQGGAVVLYWKQI